MPFGCFRSATILPKTRKHHLQDSKSTASKVKSKKEYICFEYLGKKHDFVDTVYYNCKSNSSSYFAKCTLTAEERAKAGAVYLVNGILHKTIHVSEKHLFKFQYHNLKQEDKDAKNYYLVLKKTTGNKQIYIRKNDCSLLLGCPLNANDRLNATTLDV